MLRGADIKRMLLGGAEAGLIEAGNQVLEAARADAPPSPPPGEDPDPSVSLRASGRLDVEQGGRSVVVSFNTPYAAKVHELQQAEHPHGGGPRYLEKNVKALVPKLDGIIGSEVRKQFASGRGGGRPSRRV